MSSEKLLKKFYKKVLQVVQQDRNDQETAYKVRQLLALHAKNKDFVGMLAKLKLHDVLLLINALGGSKESNLYDDIDYNKMFMDYMEQVLPIFQSFIESLKYQNNVSQRNLEIIQNQLNIIAKILSGVNSNDILRIIYALVEDYQKQPESFQNLAIAALHKIGKPVVLALVHSICDQGSEVKELPEVLKGMGHLAMPALLIALHYPEENVRYGAVEVLQKMESEDANDALVMALTDPSPRVRQKCLESLGNIMDYRTTPVIINMLKDSCSHVRLQAVKCLGKIRSSKSLDALLTTLEDEDWEVRREVVDSMALYGSSASGYLARALENDSLVVKKIASRLLADLGTDEAVPALMKAIYDNDISVRERAVIALGRIQKENSIVTLMFAFEDKAPLVRFAAIQVLVEVGSRATVHLLNKALKDPEPLIRERANAAIQEILSREEM